jgi:hypothetical protein
MFKYEPLFPNTHRVQVYIKSLFFYIYLYKIKA